MERFQNAINALLIAAVTISYMVIFIILSDITVYLSAGFSILIIYLQSEYNVLSKTINKIIDLIIKVYGE